MRVSGGLGVAAQQPVVTLIGVSQLLWAGRVGVREEAGGLIAG